MARIYNVNQGSNMYGDNVKAPISRDIRLDALKGFLIICMVLGHYSARAFYWGNHSDNKLLWISESLSGFVPFSYFRLPLFFAISVLYIERFNLSFFGKRFTAIVLPYVLWVTQASFIYAPLSDLRKISAASSSILWGNWAHIRTPMWFLPALFSVTVCFAVSKTLFLFPKSIVVRVASIIGVSGLWIWVFVNWSVVADLHCAGKIPWGINLAFYLLPYLWGLNFVYWNSGVVQNWNAKLKYPILLAMMVFGWFLIHQYEPVKMLSEYHKQIDLAQYSVPITVLGFAGFCILSSAILLLFLTLPKVKFLAWIGRYTFVIFVMHYYLIAMCSKLFHHLQDELCFLESPIWIFVASVVGFVFAVLFPVFWSKMLMRFSENFKYFGMQR